VSLSFDSRAPAAEPARAGFDMERGTSLGEIDLIDRMATALEQARAVSLAISDQLDAGGIPRPLVERLAGEIGVVHTQIVDAQELLERLASRRPRHDTS
jgi:hypothetical protein